MDFITTRDGRTLSVLVLTTRDRKDCFGDIKQTDYYLLACPTIRDTFGGKSVTVTKANTVAWATSVEGLMKLQPRNSVILEEGDYVARAL